MIAGRLHWKAGASRPNLPKKRGLARFDFSTRERDPHRSRLQTKSVASPRARREQPGFPRSRRSGGSVGNPRRVSARPRPREPHAEALAHRPAALQWNRERLLRRDPSPGAPLAGHADVEATEEDAERLYRATRETLLEWTEELRREAGDEFPEKVTAFRPRDGGPWALSRALSRLRHTGSTHRVRRERDELLPALPDRRKTPRGPRSIAAAQRRLAEKPGRAGGAEGAEESLECHVSKVMYE